jgi:hypothetical protein
MLNCKSITDEIKQDSEANKRGRWIRNRKEFHRRGSEKSQLDRCVQVNQVRSGQVYFFSVHVPGGKEEGEIFFEKTVE